MSTRRWMSIMRMKKKIYIRKLGHSLYIVWFNMELSFWKLRNFHFNCYISSYAYLANSDYLFIYLFKRNYIVLSFLSVFSWVQRFCLKFTVLSSSLVIRDASILLVVWILRAPLLGKKQRCVLSPAVATVCV